jgi:hypothetical protein
MQFLLSHKEGGLGFFSDSFRLLEAYMISKNLNQKLYVNSDVWLFKHDLGWNDWFTTLPDKTEEPHPYIKCDSSTNRLFTVSEYREAIKELFVFQPYLHDLANKLADELQLGDSYVSIFIRRGDKFLGESVYISIHAYVAIALTKNPSVIFVQTDDYRAVEEIRELVKKHDASIRVVSTCPKEKNGFFLSPVEKSETKSHRYIMPDGTEIINSENIDYLNTTPRQKPFVEYTPREIKEHVEEMLVGLILCQRSKVLVIDNMSNTSRFLFFSRKSEDVLFVEYLNILMGPETPLLPNIDYPDDKYISNPRYHCIHNGYT